MAEERKVQYWNEYGWCSFLSEFHTFELYAESYKNTCEDCLRSILEDNSIGNASRIQPAIYCARLSIELLLKFLIICRRKFDGHEIKRSWLNKISIHDLTVLANKARPVENFLNQHPEHFGDERIGYFDEIDTFISALELLDIDSTVSRYPINADGEMAILAAINTQSSVPWIYTNQTMKIEIIAFSEDFESAFSKLKELTERLRFLYYQINDQTEMWPSNILGGRLAGVK
jgi:hypothetical protein